MSGVESVGRMLLALAVILFVVWVIGRVVRRGRAGSSAAMLDVLARKQLTRNSAVAVVRVADRALVIGVTDNGVSLLGETELSEIEQHVPEAPVIAARRHAAPAARRHAAARTRPGTPPVAVLNARAAATPAAAGPLAGSILSPATWRQSVDALRDLTVRGRTSA